MSSVASDIATEILAHLRLGDGVSTPFCLVGRRTDTSHPAGFNGHNQSDCRIVSLVVHSKVIDGKRCLVFDTVDMDSAAHRARREAGLPPKWMQESVVFDAKNIDGAALYLLMTAQKLPVLAVYNSSYANALRSKDNTLLEYHAFQTPIGNVDIDNIDIAKSAIRFLDAHQLRLS